MNGVTKLQCSPRERLIAVLLALFALAGQGTSRAEPPPDFWRYWGDGKAELDGYALVEPRYGAPRAGTAVLIFVTEDFSDALHVKADPGKHPAADVYPVLKLNFVRAFQTGIYDYHLLTSVFTRIDAGFATVKASFGSQEWCGNVYQQWLVRGDELSGTLHSYFDGEADRGVSGKLPADGIFEEALPIALRGLKGDFLPPGGQRDVQLFGSAIRARFEHKPQSWVKATIRRGATTAERSVQSALGRLPAIEYTIEEAGGPTTTYVIEAAYPHRILEWRSTGGESGRILGSARLPYWQLNAPGGEKELAKIGLKPQAAAK